VAAGLVALGLFAAGPAGAQTAPLTEAPGDFRFTQVFRQFDFYRSQSGRDRRRFRYRS
jgi:hypothetical protein